MRKIAHFPYPRPHRTTLYKEPRGGASRPERRKDRSGTGARRIYASNARRYNRANDKQTETDGMIREFHQIDLSGRNSFGVGQQAARLAEFETEEDLRTIFSGGVPKRWAVLSGGNNILFTRDYDGLLLTPVARQITPLGEEGDTVRVRADATSWNGPWNAACGASRTFRSYPARRARPRCRTSAPTAAKPKT